MHRVHTGAPGYSVLPRIVAFGPERRLLRDSNTSGIGGIADLPGRALKTSLMNHLRHAVPLASVD